MSVTISEDDQNEVSQFVQRANWAEEKRQTLNRRAKLNQHLVALAVCVVIGVIMFFTAPNSPRNDLPAWLMSVFLAGLLWVFYFMLRSVLAFGKPEDSSSDLKKQAKKLIIECAECSAPLDLANFECGACKQLNVSHEGRLASPFTGCTVSGCMQPAQAGYQCGECGCVHVLNDKLFLSPGKFDDHGNGVAKVDRHVSGSEIVGGLAKGLFGLTLGAVNAIHPDGLKGAAKDIADEVDKERHDLVDRMKAQMQADRDKRWEKAGLKRGSSDPKEPDDIAKVFGGRGFKK